MILVIATLVVTNFAGIFSKSKKSNAKIQLELVSQQLELYKLDMNNYPPAELGLSALRTQPTDPVGASRWAGPYSQKEIPADPWGNPYQYGLETDPISGENGYKIWSNGPSGQSNGDYPDGDDISVFSVRPLQVIVRGTHGEELLLDNPSISTLREIIQQALSRGETVPEGILQDVGIPAPTP